MADYTLCRAERIAHYRQAWGDGPVPPEVCQARADSVAAGEAG